MMFPSGPNSVRAPPVHPSDAPSELIVKRYSPAVSGLVEGGRGVGDAGPLPPHEANPIGTRASHNTSAIRMAAVICSTRSYEPSGSAVVTGPSRMLKCSEGAAALGV